MPKTIVQKVVFKNTTATVLYDLYMNAKKHSAVTGAPAIIFAKVGAKYSAHGGYITGENLQLVKDKIIVQTWKASDWEATDEDSIFMLNIEQKGKDSILHVVHANVPDRQAKDIADGWHQYYWEPWKESLKKKPVKKVSGKKTAVKKKK